MNKETYFKVLKFKKYILSKRKTTSLINLFKINNFKMIKNIKSFKNNIIQVIYKIKISHYFAVKNLMMII